MVLFSYFACFLFSINLIFSIVEPIFAAQSSFSEVIDDAIINEKNDKIDQKVNEKLIQDAETVIEKNPVLDLISGGNMNEFFDFLKNIIEEQYKKDLEAALLKRIESLTLMPIDIKTDIQALENEHEVFIKTLKFETCTIRLCEKTLNFLKNVKFINSFLLQQQIETLSEALKSGVVTRLLMIPKPMINPSDLNSMMKSFMHMKHSDHDEESKFQVEELHDTVQNLKFFIQEYLKHGQEDLRDAVDLCSIIQLISKKILASQSVKKALHDHDFEAKDKALDEEQKLIKALARECFVVLESDCHILINNISILKEKLAKGYLNLSDDLKLEPVGKAYEFWLQEFKKYSKTMDVFLSLYRKSGYDFSLVMQTLSQFYDITQSFFNYYRFDYHDSLQGAILHSMNGLDMMLRGTIYCTGLMHRFIDQSNLDIQKVTFADQDLSEKNISLSSVESRFFFGIQTLSLIFNPTAFGRLNYSKRVAFRFVFAMVPYYINKIKSNAINSSLDLIPNGDELFKAALLVTLKELQNLLSANLQQKIIKNIDPVTLENIETFSMNLIKPELISLCLDIFFPLLFMQKQSLTGVENSLIQTPNFISAIADFKAGEVLQYERWFKIKMKSHVGNNISSAGFDAYLHSNIGLYIEYHVVQYILKNLGFFWGRYLGKVSNTPVLNALTYVGSGLNCIAENFGLCEKGTVEELTQYMGMIPTIVASFFHSQGQERIQMIAFLKNNNFLAENIYDDATINYTIIVQLISLLIKINVLNHLEAARLINKYFEHQYDITPFIDIMLATVKKNIAGAVVGGACSVLMGEVVTPWLIFNKGPFFLKAATA